MICRRASTFDVYASRADSEIPSPLCSLHGYICVGRFVVSCHNVCKILVKVKRDEVDN